MQFQIISFAILLTFYGCYFFKMFLQKRKGIQTNQIGKGKAGSVLLIEMLMKAATIIVPVVEVISILSDWSGLPIWGRTAGAVLGLLGAIVFVISVVTMRDSWRAGVSKTDKTNLVTDGIYQISRNPAFLGFDLVYIGILFMYFNWMLLAASLFAMIMLHLQIVNVEENFLITAFGEEYLAYRKKVCRYLGRKK